MTTSIPATTVSPLPPAPVGSLIYMASYLLKLTLEAEITPPDTPNMYGGKIEVLADAGDMNIDALMGPQGFPGSAQFPLRRQSTPVVNSSDELPRNLTNTPTDIGKYWNIFELDFEGVIVGMQSWIWYGASWRVTQIGNTGPPGPMPLVTPTVELITPQTPPPYPDKTSFVATSGGRAQPDWEFDLAVPAGPMGQPEALYLFGDTDFSTITANDLLAASGEFTEDGWMIWKPLSMKEFAVQYFSMPSTAFSNYTGISQQAPIGSFVIPPMPFPWTPIVWGHIGGGGISLSASPFKIGCEVLLGSPAGTGRDGVMVSRGLGNTIGEVNIMPHYSTPANKNQTISPINQHAVVPANHTNPAQGTVYINLWNDGQYGLYAFSATHAQLFMLILPLEKGQTFTPFEVIR